MAITWVMGESEHLSHTALLNDREQDDHLPLVGFKPSFRVNTSLVQNSNSIYYGNCHRFSSKYYCSK